ncbi:unnamed protein product [Fusarium venenatum]|uniref:Uncharacterized protein n=1 Tax=Fusarium venenatum TaxID=56646 RepID=A0A2L2U0R6_9HYPO|nr:uncharacterized protein FVRRES_08687 [Fusarium venenatum]CEI68610.1 unnamed protein product [Fusarium venenatum]
MKIGILHLHFIPVSLYVSDVSLFVLSPGVNEHVLETGTFLSINFTAQYDNCTPNQVERAFHRSPA